MAKHDLSELDRDQIKHMSEHAKADLNADPITGEAGSHPVTTGVGTASGAVAGAAVGSLGGPIGAAVGGVIGAVAGAAVGHKTGEKLEPTIEAAYWRETAVNRPYYQNNLDFERDYHPAYRLGYETRIQHTHDAYAKHESSLKAKWEQVKANSRLDWEQAKHATRDAWERIKN
jgi:phage tail tape-measure protein